MAKRKVQKEILKRFFIALKGEEFVDGHVTFEPRIDNAVAASV